MNILILLFDLLMPLLTKLLEYLLGIQSPIPGAPATALSVDDKNRLQTMLRMMGQIRSECTRLGVALPGE